MDRRPLMDRGPVRGGVPLLGPCLALLGLPGTYKYIHLSDSRTDTSGLKSHQVCNRKAVSAQRVKNEITCEITR